METLTFDSVTYVASRVSQFAGLPQYCRVGDRLFSTPMLFWIVYQNSPLSNLTIYSWCCITNLDQQAHICNRFGCEKTETLSRHLTTSCLIQRNGINAMYSMSTAIQHKESCLTRYEIRKHEYLQIIQNWISSHRDQSIEQTITMKTSRYLT